MQARLNQDGYEPWSDRMMLLIRKSQMAFDFTKHEEQRTVHAGTRHLANGATVQVAEHQRRTEIKDPRVAQADKEYAEWQAKQPELTAKYNLDAMHPELVPTVKEVVGKIQRDFGIPRITVHMDNERRGPLGHAFGEHFTLASKYNNMEFERDNAAADQSKKLDRVTAHEFGHVIDGIIKDAHGKEGEKNTGYESAIRKIKADHKKDPTNSHLVTIYSMKDNSEYVAEHFADAIINGDQAHPYSKKVYQAMKEWYGKNKYKGLKEAHAGFQKDKDEERARHAARLVSMVQPGEHPGNGSIIEDSSGKEYLVMMARNSIVNVAPITNGKAEVNRDSIISFSTDRDFMPASESTRYMKLFKTGRNYYDEQEQPWQQTKEEYGNDGDHAGHVFRALQQGKPVPAEVKAQYPDYGYLTRDSKKHLHKKDTINIDGKERSTKNSKGELIHATEEGIRNFYKWFGNSTVVDIQGNPLLVYHYTQHDFTEFKEQDNGRGKAFWFTASERDGNGGKRMPVYLKIEKPLDTDDQYTVEEGSWDDDIMGGIRKKKQDGIAYFDKHNPDVSNPGDQRKKGETHKVTQDESQFVVFDSSQVKSADNDGSFDGSKKHIKKSLPLTHLLRKSYHSRHDLGERGHIAFMRRVESGKISQISAKGSQKIKGRVERQNYILHKPAIGDLPSKPITPGLILPPPKQLDQSTRDRYINTFMKEFGATAGKATTFKDVSGTDLKISDRIFREGDKGPYKVFKRGREKYLPLLADTIKDPTEIWVIKNSAKSDERRYISLYHDQNGKTAGYAVFHFKGNEWVGASCYQTDDLQYLDSKRTGKLVYAKKTAVTQNGSDLGSRPTEVGVTATNNISKSTSEINKSLAGAYLLKSTNNAMINTVGTLFIKIHSGNKLVSSSLGDKASDQQVIIDRNTTVSETGKVYFAHKIRHNNLQKANIPSGSTKPASQNDVRHLPLLLKAARTLHGSIDFNGLQISIETGRSRMREWKNPHDGTQGMSRMTLPYGYAKRTLGVDGDQFDVFVGPDREAPNVFIVTTMAAPDFTEVDEQKAILGVATAEEAKRVFHASYNDPRFFGSMTEMPFAEFKARVLATKDEPKLLGGELA